MPERIDWSVTTYDGNRRRQHQEFRALPFRKKLALIEQQGEVGAYFAARRSARGSRASGPGVPRQGLGQV